MLNELQRQKITHALAEFDAGRLGAMEDDGTSCVYERDDKHCIAGCMFSRESLDKIHDADLNGASVHELTFLHVEAETGFTSRQLNALQNEHDAAFRSRLSRVGEFRSILVGLLDGTVTEVFGGGIAERF